MTDLEKAVAALIANEKTEFKEADKGALMKLSVCQLKALYPDLIEINVECGEKKTETTPATPATNQEIPKTVEEFIATAPVEMQDILTNSVNMHREKKAKMVDVLVANKNCTFTKEQLASRSIAELEALTKLAQVQVDYSGQAGNPPNTNASKIEPLTVPVMDWGKK